MMLNHSLNISGKETEFLNLIRENINRYLALSNIGCVHCGTCISKCHYSITHPDNYAMVPVYKSEQIRDIFRKYIDYTGRIISWWDEAGCHTDDEDLNKLKDIVFGTCTGCRRCTIYCPMGVENAALIRFTRGLLSEIGVLPHGIANSMRNQRETGNQFGISREEFLDTLKCIEDEARRELDDPGVEIPVDRYDCDFMYVINSREVKSDHRPLINAVKIFHRSGEKWCLPTQGWDQTNFGIFSGDDKFGCYMVKNIYSSAERLRAGRIVVSECGHGYRAARWEGWNWVNEKQKIPVESVVATTKRYIESGRIFADSSQNKEPVTFHDSCSIARFGELYEEPRFVLKHVCKNFVEMQPNGVENYCCTGGGGMMTMPEYKQLRLESAKIKAEQLKSTDAKLVCTMCYSCRESLCELIEYYNLNMHVVQILDLVANAMI